jgi:hypothetical protein
MEVDAVLGKWAWQRARSPDIFGVRKMWNAIRRRWVCDIFLSAGFALETLRSAKFSWEGGLFLLI